MIEVLLLGFAFLVAWRLPSVFDYLILSPFLGVMLGTLFWLIAGTFGVDTWRWHVFGSCILGGIFAMWLIVARVTRKE